MNDLDKARWRVAAANGDKKFKMASPCRNGHLGWRYVNGKGQCVDCQREHLQEKRSALSQAKAAIRGDEKRRKIVVFVYNDAHAEALRGFISLLNAERNEREAQAIAALKRPRKRLPLYFMGDEPCSSCGSFTRKRKQPGVCGDCGAKRE